MNQTATISNEVPTVSLSGSLEAAAGLAGAKIHLAGGNRVTTSACNGRSNFNLGTGPATEITCKRCLKKATA